MDNTVIVYRSRPIAVATEIRKKYGIIAPPINPGLVLIYHPIKVVNEDYNDEISGAFFRGEALSHIFLNANHSYERRHFTLWHEFYHFLEHTSIYFCQLNSRVSRALVEREADLFAANILMPEEWVREAFESFAGNIWTMAKTFLVSHSAMQRRVRELKLSRTRDYSYKVGG